MTCLQGHARPRGRGCPYPRTRITVLTDGFESGRVRKHRPVEPPTFWGAPVPPICLGIASNSPSQLLRRFPESTTHHTHRHPPFLESEFETTFCPLLSAPVPANPPAPATPQPNFTGSPPRGFRPCCRAPLRHSPGSTTTTRYAPDQRLRLKLNS